MPSTVDTLGSLAAAPATSTDQAPPLDALSKGGLAGVAAIFLGLAVALATLPIAQLVPRIAPDDGYFYLVLARNAVHGHWSSFDGRELTNGYHPLWFLVLTACAAVIRDGATFFRTALLLCLATYAGSAILLYRTVSRHAPPAIAVGAVALFAGLFLPTNWYLTEVGLATLLCALLFALVARSDEGGRQLPRSVWASSRARRCWRVSTRSSSCCRSCSRLGQRDGGRPGASHSPRSRQW